MQKKEARQLWCPMVRMATHYGYNSISENKGPYGKIEKSHCCITDICMMWRIEGNDPNKGYCGLGGKP